MSREWTPLPFNGFPGGLNTEDDIMALEVTELREAMNVRIGDKGEIQRRPGYTAWSQGLDTVQHYLTYWLEKSGTIDTITVDEWGHVFVAKETQVFTQIGSMGTADIGALVEYPVGFAAGEEYLYLTSLRGDHIKRWDGAELIDVDWAADPKDDEDTNVYIVPPAARHVAYRHGRLYLGSTKQNTSRVWFSHVLDPERFDEEGWVDLDPEDGTWVTAMVNFADELFIFKNHSMWELTGRDPTTYTLRTIDRLRGTVSPKTVCQMRGMLVFYDRDSGVWGYDGQQLTLLSEKINRHILDGQAYGRAGAAAAYFGDDRLYLAIPWADGTIRTFVMNAQNGAWAEYSTGFYTGSYFLQRRYQAMQNHPGLLRNNPLADTIDGEVYHSTVKTSWVDIGDGTLSRIRRMEMIADGRGGAKMTFSLYDEMETGTPMVVREVYLSHRDGPHDLAIDGWGGRFHIIQIGIEFQRRITLSRFTAMVSTILDRRGERR